MTMTPRPIAPDTDHPPATPPVEGADRVAPLLAKWAGGMAWVWTYTVSHGRLVVRLTRPAARGNLHLSCYDCRRISGPTVWGNVNLQVASEDTPEGRRFVVRDESNKVEIRCGFLTAQENVEPIY
ncbi:MAG: hypothetical protein JWO31_4258 [Phycisphaerales bacterium]|nr:hypothetical protein [Phycisphaerales bacterium]